MKLRTLFECFKCFMIGNYKDTNSGIEDNLYPQDIPYDVYHRNSETPSVTLYTPPSEDVENIITKKSADDCACTHVNYEPAPVNSTPNLDEQVVNLNTDVFKSMSCLIVELDIVKQRLASDETIQMITFCQDKIIEGLSGSGAKLIENDESYSNTRHCPMPYGIYPEGIPIKRIIRPGVMVQNEVVLKALIEL